MSRTNDEIFEAVQSLRVDVRLLGQRADQTDVKVDGVFRAMREHKGDAFAHPALIVTCLTAASALVVLLRFVHP